ncbi:Metalloendopeptidase OMA1, mitochondrial [Triplophysa tibetana]|uniref:Metalloendopeptidase OMA1, mitochondrial n=1 Tax=Triplophysa tibetana TaxID=1572043 RepID=A0A5A9NHE0_9TELE|nr:Metalloendopeptidase OMA1, mitochondrial [Triplophysa tibetana]
MDLVLRLTRLNVSTLTTLNRYRLFTSGIRWRNQRHFHTYTSNPTRTHFLSSVKGSLSPTSLFLTSTSRRFNICVTAFKPPSQRFTVIIQPKHQFHTSGSLRALPAPFIWLVLKPVQKVVAIILGRSIRKWWRALPPNKKQLFREWTWRRRWHLAGAGAGFMFLVSLFFLSHLDESPVTGRTRMLVFSRENFIELGKYTADAYMEEFKESLVPTSDPRHQAVELLVQHLTQRNQDIAEISSVSWNVHVVEGPTVNAFVLPNGEVFIFTGMLEAVSDIHQLAFILGHEMSHALIGHAAEQASLSHVVELLSLILLTAIWAICPRDSLAVLGHWIQSKLVQFTFDRPFSRKLEAEADQVGLQLAAKACADVRAGPVFWQQMEIAEQLKGEPNIPEWLSTHPSHQNRVRELNRLIPEALELRARCDCPALPSTDPRVTFSQNVQLILEDAKKQELMEKEEKIGKEKAGVMFPLPHTALVPAQGTQVRGLLATSALPQNSA